MTKERKSSIVREALPNWMSSDYDDDDYYYEEEYRNEQRQRRGRRRRYENESPPPSANTRFKTKTRQDEFQIPKDDDDENENNKETTINTYYRIDVEVLTASNLPTDRDVMDTSDPYCKIKIGNVADQTNVIFNINEKEQVVWNERMDFYIPTTQSDDDVDVPPPDDLIIQVWDWDANTKDDLIGLCFVSLSRDMFVVSNQEEEEDLFVEKTLQLYHPDDGDVQTSCGDVRIRYRCRLWKEGTEEDNDDDYAKEDEANYSSKQKSKQQQQKMPSNRNKNSEDYDDDYDDYDDDYEDETTSAPGNFWSNPKPGLDPYPSERLKEERRKRRAEGGDDNLPPTTADASEPGRRRPPRQQRRPSSGRRRQSEEKYGVPPPSRSSTFRSGVPPPPGPMKDFYDRLFWYGFDSEDTTSPADRTMFGGTRGKFNGLDLLRDRDEGKWDTPRRKRVWDEERERYVDTFEYDDDDNGRFYGNSRRRQRQQQQQRRQQEYYDDDDYEIDGDSDDFDEEEWGLKRKRGKRVRPDAPTLPPARRRRDDGFYDNNYRDSYEDDSGDEYQRRLADAFERKMRSKRRNADWVSGEVSTWFETQPASRGGYDYDEDEDDYDDDDYVVERRRSDRRMRRAGSKQKSKGLWDVSNVLDVLFDLDSEAVDAKAKEYDLRTGKRKRDRSRMKSDGLGDERRRKGYAYRYVDDDGSPPVADYELVDVNEEISIKETIKPVVGDDDDDEKLPVPDNQSTQGNEETKMRQMAARDSMRKKQQRPTRKRSWEERARDVDRVPPSGVTAWGPEGEVKGGIDARSQAAIDAMEEIQDAKRMLEKKEAQAIDAEEMVIVAKTDANLQRKRMEARREEIGTTRLREKLRTINAGVNNAARALRRARAEVQFALNKVQELEDRHWALLSDFDAEEEFESEPRTNSSDGKNSINSEGQSSQENIESDTEGDIDLDKIDEEPKK